MTQRERELCRRVVAFGRIDFQAAQNDLLQPPRTVRTQRSGRRRIAVEAPPQTVHGGRIAVGTRTRYEVVEDHAEREDIASQVVADVQDLLGRDVRRGADGLMK